MENDALTPSPGSDPPEYEDVVWFEESPLYQAVVNADSEELRHFLDLEYDVKETGRFRQTLLHGLVYSLSSQPPEAEIWNLYDRIRIVYMLSNSGLDVNIKDQYQKTALQYAVQCGDNGLCEALLQCGADMFAIEENGLPLYNNVMDENENTSGNQNVNLIMDTFEKYQPGLWQAVASEDLTAVRKLINLWCKTDLYQNGKTLQEMAIRTRNEGIISLINAVIPSMRLVYHVLACDVKGVKEIFNSELRSKIHINLKNLGYYSAPILYFVIKEKNLEMLKEFQRHGCSIVTHMCDKEDNEMPVLFSALSADMPASIIAQLLPDPNADHLHLLEHLTYKGQNILQIALANHVSCEAVDVILQQGGARLVCERNMFNQTSRDWANVNNMQHYVEMIDKHVIQWVLHGEFYPGRRETLVLWGYEHISNITNQWLEDNAVPLQNIPEDAFLFLENIDIYQEQIYELAEAVEANDFQGVLDKMIYTGNGSFESNLWWNGRSRGDGLPLLHRAVIHNSYDVALLLLDTWEKQCGNDSIDSLRDQSRRTALHYAFGMGASNIISLLYQYGCSEHMLDKDGHEPLDFSEVQGTREMISLLERIKNKQYSTEEPNPWKPEILAEVRRQRNLQLTCDHNHIPPAGNVFSFHSKPASPCKVKPAKHTKHDSLFLSHSQSHSSFRQAFNDDISHPRRRQTLTLPLSSNMLSMNRTGTQQKFSDLQDDIDSSFSLDEASFPLLPLNNNDENNINGAQTNDLCDEIHENDFMDEIKDQDRRNCTLF